MVILSESDADSVHILPLEILPLEKFKNVTGKKRKIDQKNENIGRK
jgi:hypothetical protein